MTHKPWTPEEDAIIRHHYPAGGLKACKRRLPHRSAMAIQQRANRLGLRYAELEGYINANEVAKLSGTHISNVTRRAKQAGVARCLGGQSRSARVLIREDWALAYIEECRVRREAEEARKAGYLTTNEVARTLGIGFATVQRWRDGQRSWLARRFGQPRTIRGERGRILWNPVDVERVRVELEKERRAAREMKAVKALAIEARMDRSGMFYRLARESRRSLVTLAGGRLVRFTDLDPSAA